MSIIRCWTCPGFFEGPGWTTLLPVAEPMQGKWDIWLAGLSGKLVMASFKGLFWEVDVWDGGSSLW